MVEIWPFCRNVAKPRLSLFLRRDPVVDHKPVAVFPPAAFSGTVRDKCAKLLKSVHLIFSHEALQVKNIHRKRVTLPLKHASLRFNP
jgi:hypothetical protein